MPTTALPARRNDPEHRRPGLHAMAIWLLALILITNLGFMAKQSLDDIESQQITEARRSSRFIVQNITRRLEEERRQVALFAELHRDKISALIRSPNDTDAYETVHQAVARFFPEAFAFTLANNSGQVLIDDFDGLVGEVCQNNIRHFAEIKTDQPIFIHPHPEVYHYDVMAPFDAHIFFISFRPDDIVQGLRENATLGQTPFLLKAGSTLIELAPEGTRLNLKRDFKLSPDEMAALLLRLPVKDTAWELATLPDIKEVKAQQRKIYWQLGTSAIAVLLLTALMQWLLGIEAKRRSQAERRAKALSELSVTDALTGLANRRALDETLEREWSWMERSGHPLTVMMLDVDHFKLYNDHLGHLAGDAALRTVARVMASVVNRPRDLVGRFGGEEFMIILPDTPCPSAEHVASSLHAALKRLAVAHPESPTSPLLTLSIGLVCATPNLVDSPSALILLADEALYEAKHGGRNRTVARPKM